jgi:hypothetical protein
MTQKQKSKVSKAAFVRARPTASVDEVIAAGKAEGIDISRQAVHQVRHQARFEAQLKAKGKKRKAAKKAATAKVVAKTATNGHAKSNVKVPSAVLAKYPGMQKTHEALDPNDEKEVADRLALSLRLMVRQSVRAEVRALLGGALDVQ